MKRKILFVGGEKESDDLAGIFKKAGVGFVRSDKERLFPKREKGKSFDLVVWDMDHENGMSNPESLARFIEKVRRRHGKIVILSSRKDFRFVRTVFQAGSSDYIVKPFNYRELLARIFALLENKKKICCIGGGTGLFTLLNALKTLPGVLLTALVNMSDDGGSSGRLRSSFGILPPGDIRRSLVALSNAPMTMNEVIGYRFRRGGELREHSVGNLLLTALTEIKGSMAEAVRALGDILNVQGVVLPITQTLTDLVARFENGKVVRGESRIGAVEARDPQLKIQKVWHEPEAEGDANAYASILHADLVVIGPGDLFTSVVTNLVIPRIREAIGLTKGEKIYVCNLMTRPGETAGLDATEHVREIVKALGGDRLDRVVVSGTRFSKAALHRYARLGQYPVFVNERKEFKNVTKAKITVADIADELALVRHDFEKLRRLFARLLGRA